MQRAWIWNEVEEFDAQDEDEPVWWDRVREGQVGEEQTRWSQSYITQGEFTAFLLMIKWNNMYMNVSNM